MLEHAVADHRILRQKKRDGEQPRRSESAWPIQREQDTPTSGRIVYARISRPDGSDINHVALRQTIGREAPIIGTTVAEYAGQGVPVQVALVPWACNGREDALALGDFARRINTALMPELGRQQAHSELDTVHVEGQRFTCQPKQTLVALLPGGAELTVVTHTYRTCIYCTSSLR